MALFRTTSVDFGSMLCFVALVGEVYRIAWWMAHYGARSPKRQKAFCNNKAAHTINLGRLTKSQKDKLDVKTTVRTKGGGYQGSSALKSTQLLSHRFLFGREMVVVLVLGGRKWSKKRM